MRSFRDRFLGYRGPAGSPFGFVQAVIAAALDMKRELLASSQRRAEFLWMVAQKGDGFRMFVQWAASLVGFELDLARLPPPPRQPPRLPGQVPLEETDWFQRLYALSKQRRRS